MWCSRQFRNQICCGALYVLWGGYWRFDRCSHGNSVKFVAWVCCISANSRPSTMNSLFRVQRVMVHVFPRLAMCQQRPKWDTWEGERRPSSHVVLCHCRVKNQAQLMLEATSKAEWCWSRPLTTVILNPNEDTLGLFPYGFLICWMAETILPLILPLLQWEPLVINWWHYAARSALKRDRRFWTRWWEVGVPQCVATAFRFLLFTVFSCSQN